MSSTDIIRMNNELIMRQIYMNMSNNGVSNIDNPITNMLVNVLLVVCIIGIIIILCIIIYDLFKEL